MSVDGVICIIKKGGGDCAPGPNGIPQAIYKNDPSFRSKHLFKLYKERVPKLQPTELARLDMDTYF